MLIAMLITVKSNGVYFDYNSNGIYTKNKEMCQSCIN